MNCEAVILAAGLGTRMNSNKPKVLHPLLGQPMLQWSVRACRAATNRIPYVVVGPEIQDELAELVDEEVETVLQSERLGTGHATMQAGERLRGKSDCVLVVNADNPLFRSETLRQLIKAQNENPGPLTILTAHASSSRGFGRVLRDENGVVQGVVEEAHASLEQLSIEELNVGGYCYRASWLWENLPRLPLSPKGEYYLTDLVALAVKQGERVNTIAVEDPGEVIGINNRRHLAEAESALRERINLQWLEAGVTMIDPDVTYIGPDVQIGRDTTLFPNTILTGKTIVGEACTLGPNTSIEDSTIGDQCHIQFSVLEEAVLAQQVDVGPFAHIRRGSVLGRGVHMGNFGELKNSALGDGVKMGHFSYIGDATIGDNVNIGAGTVTCNFDGKHKHRTQVEQDAFIGSDTMLVAPVRVGKGARTGAGAVVTRDVPDSTVAVGIPARVIRKVDSGE
jgi:bifunctional UDP-N-acetylglucosamine pyrophosphorylase/glucosamine-1-phosphate N-acetyltransferase